MDKVKIELDRKWVRRVRSPMIWIVSSLTGVSISFAPWFLYLSGAGRFHPEASWAIVPLCFAVIYLVPLFYFRLGAEVVRELRKVPP